jgi:ABC-2 type transport system permease protein
MTWWRTVWIVARWELATTVARAGFIVVLLGLPLAHVGLAAIIGSAVRAADEPVESLPVVVVDEHWLLESITDGRDVVRRSEPEALRDLSNGAVGAVFVVPSDYLQMGRVRAYAHPPRGLTYLARRESHRDRAATVIRRGLIASITPERAERLVEPLRQLERFEVGPQAIRPEPPFPLLAMFAGPFGISFVLGLSIFLSAGLLEQATSAELQNRTLEVLLSITTPVRLLTGKVIGLAAAGFLQVMVYMAATVGILPILGLATVPIGDIAWSATVFLAGYLLFAVLLAATGALTRDAREIPQIASLVMLVAALPFFFLAQVSADRVSWLVRLMTWFPPTAPVTLLLRQATGSIGALEGTAAVVLIVVATAALLHLAARLLAARLDGSPLISRSDRTPRARFGHR